MRIALTSNFSPWSPYSGGAQRSTHALADALVARGHDVHVVYTASPWAHPAVPDHTAYHAHFAAFVGLRARRTAPLRSLNAYTVARVLRRLHAAAPLDVVHSQGEEGAAVRGLPFRSAVTFVATPRFPAFPEGFGQDMKPVLRLRYWLLDSKYPMLGRTLSGADHVTTTSRATADEVARRYRVRRQDIAIVPNGVHGAFLAQTWRGSGPEGPLVYFGRVEADKGVDLVIRAVARTDRRLLVVGRGSFEAACRRLARDLGLADRVEFMGWQSPAALAKLLASSALAVLPSLHESFGNTMAEAMAVGTPLISTTAGSIPEVTDQAAVALVAPGDVDGLGRAVEAALADPLSLAERSRDGRARIRQHFSWDAVAATYERIYTAPP